MDLVAQLNSSQREAVTWVDGPALVLAGPGSGKTRVLTHRVAYLVRECGVSPQQIVAVTFTNKAAREMKERLLRLLGPQCEALTVGTFHAICARILRRDGTLLGFAPSFTIYDRDDQLAVVKRILKELNIDDKIFRPGAVHSLISKAKNDLVAPEDYRPGSYREEIAARIYERYQRALQESNALDFDDLLMYVVKIFQSYPDALSHYRRRYSHVLVDEFQDTNIAQYVLLKLLTEEHRNLFVVADEDQSIYSWRGADFRNIQRFREDFHGARTILLERNYRSTQTILDTANSVISYNIHRTPKKLYTDQGEGVPVTIHEAYDEQEEGRFVLSEIRRLVAEGECRPGDCAVMYRTNAQSRAIEEAFLHGGQPYKLVGATRFYERREIKDSIAYLRILYNPADAVSLNRVVNTPPRGLGEKTLATLFSWATELGCSAWEALRLLGDETQEGGGKHPFSARAATSLLKFLKIWEGLVEARETSDAAALLQQVLEKTGYEAYLRDGTDEGEDRWNNVMELLAVAAQYSGVSNSLAVFLEEVALVSDVDDLGEHPDVPVLLTLHMAKGLEFPVVFIVGMEEGILPHSRSSTSAEELEEERRLCYVGITRAKHRLYLVHTFRRSTYGRSDPSEPSRFLRDIPTSLMQGHLPQASHPTRAPSRLLGKRTPPSAGTRRIGQKAEPAKPPQEPAFRAGDRVAHPKFGEGTVKESRLLGDDEQVTVEFPQKGEKVLLARFAKLEKVR